MDKPSLQQQSQAIGRILLQEGLITENQLHYAIEVANQPGQKKRLTEILVDLGYVTKRQLREVARRHKLRVPLGQILLESGLITEQQLQEALAEQTLSAKPLGEILVAKGLISEEQLAQALSEQLNFPYIVPNRRLVDRVLLKLFPDAVLREHTILPLFMDGDTVTVLIPNPEDQAAIAKIEQYTKGNFDLAIGPRSAIRQVLKEVLLDQYQFSTRAETQTRVEEAARSGVRRYVGAPPPPEAGPERQAVSILDYLLSSAIRSRASDIHIESLKGKIRVRYRIDGKLTFQTDLPGHVGDRIVRRIKVLAGLDVSDTTSVVDGHFFLNVDNTDFDLRVSVLPTVFGCSVTIRALTREIGLKDLGDLGMVTPALVRFRRFLDSPAGLVLFSGPTGSGKTTSLYAALNYLNRSDMKIVTLEEPVEFSIEGISQSELRTTAGKGMLDKIRVMMRQDPDVIVVGEIKDDESAEAVVQAVQSGHKVFSTIHADDAFGAVLRIMDRGLRNYLLASTGLASVAQRLVRQNCPQCRAPYHPRPDIYAEFHVKGSTMDAWSFMRGMGCPACNQLGFYGRTGVFEMLLLDPGVRDALLSALNAAELRRVALETGNYLSMREAAFIKAAQGYTPLEEAFGLLSYSEQQAFAHLALDTNTIRAWMTPNGGDL